MSYTCKDHGEGLPCNGCKHDTFGAQDDIKPPQAPLHPFGCNRAERRAAMKARKPGFSKQEQEAAREKTR